MVVDDGNQNSQPIFSTLENMDCKVVHHATNLGKGRALKTGFNAVLIDYPELKGLVTADADGQHLPSDIMKLVKELEASTNLQEIVLGSRVFDKNTPLRSKIGNYMTSSIFKSLIGLKVSDTQTGLRAIPKTLLVKMMRLDGERYEFETNMLLFCKEEHVAIREVPIATVYLDDNASSSFNPFFDSMKIYFLLLRFIMSSLSFGYGDYIFTCHKNNDGFKSLNIQFIFTILKQRFINKIAFIFSFNSNTLLSLMIFRDFYLLYF